MRPLIVRAASAAALGLQLACAAAGPHPEGFTRAPEGVLYSLGYALGESASLHAFDEAELEQIRAGLSDRVRNRAPRHGPVSGIQGEIGDFLALRSEEMAVRERAAGQPFLEAAAREEGAVVTEAGAILTVWEPGEGSPPGDAQTILLYYRGTLRDGSVLHANRRDEPRRLELVRANRCWKEALRAVGSGARLRVVCPPDLADAEALGGPPGALLVWELELLDVLEE